MMIIGVGNEFRNDDRVGRLIARKLRELMPPDSPFTVTETDGEGVTLMQLWQGVDTVILIDAVSTGKAPGTIYQIDAHVENIPTGFFCYSSHSFGVAEAIALAKQLDELPAQVFIYGIEGANFATGQTLSPPVETAMQTIVNRICERHLLNAQA